MDRAIFTNFNALAALCALIFIQHAYKTGFAFDRILRAHIYTVTVSFALVGIYIQRAESGAFAGGTFAFSAVRFELGAEKIKCRQYG